MSHNLVMRNIAQKSAFATSYDWVEYFYQNAPEPVLPWTDPVRLSVSERKAVMASIQQFQLGEGASGARMFGTRAAFCARNGRSWFHRGLEAFFTGRAAA